MLIDDIDNHWKLLLMMGIGVFAAQDSDRYTEIMKKLAQEPETLPNNCFDRLHFMGQTINSVMATYQLISRAMSQKRLFRLWVVLAETNFEFDYTIRFRNDAILKKLFEYDADKPEVRNMRVLFNS